LAEQQHDFAPRGLGQVPRGGSTLNGAPCAVGCCEPLRRPAQSAV
jgi:protoporphyrin/coproporphyrin ferrochelatase